MIAAALREINVLASGEVPSSDEAADALTALNNLLDSWSAEALTIFTEKRIEFTLVVNQQSYTYGTGGDFDDPRPANINRAGIISLQSSPQDLELPISYLTEAQWAAIPVKNIKSSLPMNVWDDGGFPYRTLSFWCIPSQQCKVALYPWVALTEYTDLTTDNTYPPGYARAITSNLAIELAPQFGAAAVVSQALIAKAMESKTIIKRNNIEPIDLRCDTAIVQPGRGLYNYITDMGARGGNTN